jgi:hypothetical protein
MGSTWAEATTGFIPSTSASSMGTGSPELGPKQLASRVWIHHMISRRTLGWAAFTTTRYY